MGMLLDKCPFASAAMLFFNVLGGCKFCLYTNGIANVCFNGQTPFNRLTYNGKSFHTLLETSLQQFIFRTVDKYDNIIRKKVEEISNLEQQLRESATKQQKMQENREKIERELNDALKKLQIEKERLLTRYVHRTRDICQR